MARPPAAKSRLAESKTGEPWQAQHHEQAPTVFHTHTRAHRTHNTGYAGRVLRPGVEIGRAASKRVRIILLEARLLTTVYTALRLYKQSWTNHAHRYQCLDNARCARWYCFLFYLLMRLGIYKTERADQVTGCSHGGVQNSRDDEDYPVRRIEASRMESSSACPRAPILVPGPARFG